MWPLARLQSRSAVGVSGISVYEYFLSVIITKEAVNPCKPALLEQVTLKFLHAKDTGTLKIHKDKVLKFDGIVEWNKADQSTVVTPRSIADVLAWILTKNHSKKNLELLEKLFSITQSY